MGEQVTMFVGLKIPDTTAITALQAVKARGGAFGSVVDVIRETVYEFDVSEKVDSFQDTIKNVDVLVNANKNVVSFGSSDVKVDEKYSSAVMRVWELDDDGSSLRTFLTDRLGISGISSVSKKTQWTIVVDGSVEDAQDIAEELGSTLFSNRHFEGVEFL